MWTTLPLLLRTTHICWKGKMSEVCWLTRHHIALAYSWVFVLFSTRRYTKGAYLKPLEIWEGNDLCSHWAMFQCTGCSLYNNKITKTCGTAVFSHVLYSNSFSACYLYLYHAKRPYFQEESSGSSDFKDSFRRSGIVAVRNVSTTVQMLAGVCNCWKTVFWRKLHLRDFSACCIWDMAPELLNFLNYHKFDVMLCIYNSERAVLKCPLLK